VLQGVIPPGVSIPLHSHPDTEDFFIISGQEKYHERKETKTVPSGASSRFVKAWCTMIGEFYGFRNQDG
jgi:hypothetical protein